MAWGTERYERRQFELAEEQRIDTLKAQFLTNLRQSGEAVAEAVQGVAEAEATLRMAMDLSRPKGDPSMYANDARGLANIYHLDFLDLVAGDGSIISSTRWPLAPGAGEEWVRAEKAWNRQPAFLSRVQLPERTEVAQMAVRIVQVGEHNFYIVGGRRFDRAILETLALPQGTRALLYSNVADGFSPAALSAGDGPAREAELFAGIIGSALQGRAGQPQLIRSLAQDGSGEAFTALSLAGRSGEIVAVLLVGSSRSGLDALVTYIRSLAALAVAGGILLGLLLSWWAGARISKPLREMAEATKQIESGKLHLGLSALEPRSGNEAGQLAAAFRNTIVQLGRHQERMMQSERAAARREMARRLTREIKESLFPLQMATEDLLCAREETSERFDEIFFECTATLQAELERLKNIASRFGEFSRMPAPRLAPVSVNETVRAAMQNIQTQLHWPERPPVTPEVYAGEADSVIMADPDLLRIGLENLLLHCIEAMPTGGSLVIRTKEEQGTARLEITAAGAKLEREEAARLFVPRTSTLTGGNGLGLATAQAIVADHGGRISAEPLASGGVLLRVEFSAVPAGVKPVGAREQLAAARLPAGKAALPGRREQAEPQAREAVAAARLFT